MAQNGNGNGPAIAGQCFIGPFEGFEVGEARDNRSPLVTVRLSGFKRDGEPYWFKAWCPSDDKVIMQSLQALKVGESVALGVTARGNKEGYVSYRAEWVRSLEAVPQPA